MSGFFFFFLPFIIISEKEKSEEIRSGKVLLFSAVYSVKTLSLCFIWNLFWYFGLTWLSWIGCFRGKENIILTMFWHWMNKKFHSTKLKKYMKAASAVQITSSLMCANHKHWTRNSINCIIQMVLTFQPASS